MVGHQSHHTVLRFRTPCLARCFTSATSGLSRFATSQPNRTTGSATDENFTDATSLGERWKSAVPRDAERRSGRWTSPEPWCGWSLLPGRVRVGLADLRNEVEDQVRLVGDRPDRVASRLALGAHGGLLAGSGGFGRVPAWGS